MHTEYDAGARPIAGKVNAIAMLDKPEFTNDCGNTVGVAQLVPTTSLIARILIALSRATPVTVIMVDTPAAPLSTVKGENEVADGTYKSELETFRYVPGVAARK